MRLRLISPLFIAALIILPGCSRPRPSPARPALFVVRDADTIIWLFGTIHALPSNVTWETPAIRHAIDRADMLVTEILPPDPAAIGAQFAALAHGNGLPTIAARAPARLRPALERAIADAGETASVLDAQESWAVALALENGRARAAGASAANGVERVLARRFAGRPQRALETAGSQLALFDGLSAPDQRRLLVLAITDRDGYARTLAAWSAGNVAAMARSNDRLFAGAPAMHAALLTDRNIRWSRWIARRMRMPGKVFVAVGAGHLAGRESVVAMLRQAGLSVRRVQ